MVQFVMDCVDVVIGVSLMVNLRVPLPKPSTYLVYASSIGTWEEFLYWMRPNDIPILFTTWNWTQWYDHNYSE